MTDFINIPVMIVSPTYRESFFVHLAHSIEKFETPEGIVIKKVYDNSDSLMEHIFDQVKKANENEEGHPLFAYENYNMLEIVFESDHPVRFQKLPWLDEQIKDVVRNYEDSVGLYFPYLIEQGQKFHISNIARVFRTDKYIIVEDDETDNWSALTEMSMFLSSYWYESPEQVVESFPDIIAKIILLLDF